MVSAVTCVQWLPGEGWIPTPEQYLNETGSTSLFSGMLAYDLKTWLPDDLMMKADKILMAEGTYLPTRIYVPNGIVGGASGLQTENLKTFDLPDQVAIYGGFSDDEKSGFSRFSHSSWKTTS